MIRILGFKKPNLPDWDNVEFISMAPIQQDIKLWSKYIYNYFKTIDDKLVFLALDDFFPIDYLNTECYNYILDYMNNNSVGYCTVGPVPSTRPNRNEVENIIKDDNNIFLYRRKKPINYQLTLQPGIWNREYLLKAFDCNCTPWEFELDRTRWANNDNTYFNISSSNFSLYTDSYKCLLKYSTSSSLSSKWKGISITGLKNETVGELIENNLVNKNDLIFGAWNKYIKWHKNINKTDLLNFNELEWTKLYKDCYT